MSLIASSRRRLRLAGLVVRSSRAARGARRHDHPFVAGLRIGQVIPHQGGHWPDAHPNTMAAYGLAAERSQILDIDVWASADEVLVCAHDDELAGGGRISESTWTDLAATTELPRLIDVATAFPDHRLNVEIKDGRGLFPIEALMATTDLAARTCLSTFNPLLARALAGAVPHAAHARPTARRIGRIWGAGDVIQTMTFVPDAAPALGAAKPFLLRALFTAGSPELVAEQVPIALRVGMPLFAWTVNDRAPLRDLVDAGADAVMSDDPTLFDDPQIS